MKKRLFNGILLGTAALLCAGGFAACKGSDGNNGGAEKTQIEEVYESYVAYAEENGETPLSYEEWLASIKGEKGDKGDTGANGKDGKNGVDGKDGTNGKDGVNGTNGKDGADGKTPYIGANGNWWIGETDTGVKAAGKDGTNGVDGKDGKDGADGEDGVNGTNGKDGVSVVGATIDENGNLILTLSDGSTLNAGQVAAPDKIDENNKITFKDLGVNGKSVKGKVSNATTEVDFCELIETKGFVDFRVFSDIGGRNEYITKHAELKEGDNLFYVFETCGRAYNIYELTLRRAPMYTITFDTDGGTPCEAQQVEEGAFAKAPETTRAGYGFDGWGYDFEEPIMDNITVKAQWKAIYAVSDGKIIGVTEYGRMQKELVVPSVIDGTNITEIGERAFYDFSVLEKVEISEGIKVVGKNAFYVCVNLTSVVVKGAETIEKFAFWRCDTLSKIELPDSIEKVSGNAFQSPANIGSKYDNAYYLGNERNPYLVLIQAISSNITECEINEGTKVIAGYAFSSCMSISGIAIPDSVQIINENAFYACKNLKTVSIGKNVQKIASDAFYKCTSLTTIKYGGTKQQWEELSSSLEFDAVKTVECFDGTITYGQDETTSE